MAVVADFTTTPAYMRAGASQGIPGSSLGHEVQLQGSAAGTGIFVNIKTGSMAAFGVDANLNKSYRVLVEEA
jgi:hypothetical protein